MCLTCSQWQPERDEHVMGEEGAAYKVRYRPVQELSQNGKACGKYMISHNNLFSNANNRYKL
jgi:hypothetical protein